MFFIIIARDKPGMLQVRQDTKSLHMAHLDAGAPGVEVLQSGPLLDEGGDEAGSLIIVRATDSGSVERFLAGDPYVAAGLFAEHSIQRWLWRRGNPFL